MRSTPLIVGLALINVGWATGGGAAQILFSVFGEIVFRRGAAGIGTIWSFAGIGCGGRGHRTLVRQAGQFWAYKRAIVICYIIHGGAYVIFSQMRSYALALLSSVFRARPGAQLGAEFRNCCGMSRTSSRAGVLDHRVADLVGDDALDDGRGRRLAVLQPATIGLWSGVLTRRPRSTGAD